MLCRNVPSGMWLLTEAVLPTVRLATGEAKRKYCRHHVGGDDSQQRSFMPKVSSVGTSMMRTIVAKMPSVIATSWTVWNPAKHEHQLTLPLCLEACPSPVKMGVMGSALSTGKNTKCLRTERGSGDGQCVYASVCDSHVIACR